jgi:hypothetical protein
LCICCKRTLLFFPLIYSSCNFRIRLAMARKRLVYASNKSVIAGNKRAGVLIVSSIYKVTKTNLITAYVILQLATLFFTTAERINLKIEISMNIALNTATIEGPPVKSLVRASVNPK